MSQGMTPEQESDSISHASLDSDPGAEPDRVPHLPVQRGATGILTAGSEALDPKQVQLVADVIARWERPFKDAPKGAPALRDCSYLFKWGTPVQRVDNTIIRTIDCLSSKIESAALVAQSGFAPGTLPSILLVFDRLYDDVIVDTAAAYYLAKIADKEPYLMPSWINAVRELRDTPGEAAERRAAALEREVRIKVSEHICTSFPSKRFVGQVEPDLGLALSRVAGTREEAQILSDVLMKRGAFKAKLHTQIDQLVQGYPFASRSAVSRSMSDARNQLCKLLGWCELPTVNVGVHLERPLAYDSSSRTLNFDLSLLAIEENSRVALIESSINPMPRRSR